MKVLVVKVPVLSDRTYTEAWTFVPAGIGSLKSCLRVSVVCELDRVVPRKPIVPERAAGVQTPVPMLAEVPVVFHRVFSEKLRSQSPKEPLDLPPA